MGGEADGQDSTYAEPTAYDPHWSFTIVIVVVCVLINLSLPLWLRLGDLWKKDEKEDAQAQRSQEDGFFNRSTVSGSVASKNLTSRRKGPQSVVSGTSSALITDVAAAILDARPRRNAGTHLKGPKKRRVPNGGDDRDVRMVAEQTIAQAAFQAYTADTSVPNSDRGSAREDRSVASLSIMSKLDLDDVSARDAVDAKDAGIMSLTTIGHSSSSGWEKVLEVADWDKEMRKFTSLAVPFSIQGLTREFFVIVNVAVIGHLIGVTEANAFVVVNILVLFTGTLTKGFAECIGVLVPHANGAGNDLLVGRYLQLGVIFYTFLGFPGAILWTFMTEKAVLWFDFDQETATIGQQYAYTLVIYLFLEGFMACFTEFLNTLDHENYATVASIVAHGTQSVVISVLAVVGVKDLVVIGLSQIAVGILEIIVNLTIMTRKGWLDDYWEGIFRTNGLKDRRAIRTLFITAIPLSAAWLLTFGEWEVMTLFAAYMGPSEVAAWGIIGYVWSAFEAITDAFGDAAEVRVGFRMGAGQTQIAKIVAEKGIYAGFVIATICCGLLFIVAQYLPGWLTPDPTLQNIIFDILPLIGFGQILMVPGMVAWAIVGAQGRVRLATAIEFAVSWFVALPISAVLVYAFDFNLEGMVGALVLGYTIGANIYLYVLYKSDWEALSAVVVARNAAEGILYDEFDWDDLPQQIQDAAITLGYNQDLWENDGEAASSDKSWNELTAEEQLAAGLLGFDRKKWDADSDTGDDDDSIDCEKMPYDDYDWSELPPNAMKAVIALGYTEESWGSDGDGPLDSKEWAQLTSDQQEAAKVLGYKQKWTGDSENEDLPSYDSDDWNDLPPEVRKAAKQLGYTKKSWDFGGRTAVDDKPWNQLNPKQQQAAKILGYNEMKWNGDDVDDDESDETEELPSYDDDDWDCLPKDVRRAAEVLGHSKTTWDSGARSPVDDKDWNELTVKQRNAATIVGYNERKWNEEENEDGATSTKNVLSLTEQRDARSPGSSFLDSVSSVMSSESTSSATSPPTGTQIQQDIASEVLGLQNLTTGKEVGNLPDANPRPNFDDCSWRRLPPKAQEAATILGYTEETWDADGTPSTVEKGWIQLSPEEQSAASILGYTLRTWDA